VALLNSSEYYEASCPDEFENLTLKVPCALLRSRVPEIDDSCARLGLAHPALAKAVTGLASPLLSPEPPLNNHQEEGVAESILDLLELMLENETGTRDLGASALQRIRTFIHDNLSDHELSPVAVAQANAISVRYLHKLFASAGSTFGRELMEARLERANNLIQSNRHTKATLQQIAFACGFSSQSHFSTAFRLHFGITPRLARKSEI
jgi:AraC-like DNA-binding protein